MSSNRLSNLTIVVVEDHNDARTSLGLFLKYLGANVVLAKNAFEGIEAVKNSRPNIVLSDISMPDRDGWGLLRDIRALGPHAGGANYFARIKKDQILQAIQEATGAPVKERLRSLKKQALAAEAEHSVTGTRWLPELLRN